MTPTILGIVNITTDSFSDGGKYLAADAALTHARQLVQDGAAILDLGAAASNPNAEAVAPETEIARLAPVVAALHSEGIALSIDSFSPPVQAWALNQGVAYLNDIHGFANPALYPRLADSDTKLIVMHAVQSEGRATIDDIPADAIYQRVVDFFSARLEALERAKIASSRLILDPGMGMFLSRQPQASYEMLRRIPDLKRSFGLPVLIGVSRKSFLRPKETNTRSAQSIPAASLAAEIFATCQGADYIRTHDVAALAAAQAVWMAATSGHTTSL